MTSSKQSGPSSKRSAKRERRATRRRRGNALLIVVIMIMIMAALGISYSGMSVVTAHNVMTSEDGFIDFRDQTSTAKFMALSRTTHLDGTYTVRTQPLGTINSQGYYGTYKIRAFGVYQREVQGIEAFVYRFPPPPTFEYADY